METMTIGMCLDYIDEYIEQNDPNKVKKVPVREASQAEIDNF